MHYEGDTSESSADVLLKHCENIHPFTLCTDRVII